MEHDDSEGMMKGLGHVEPVAVSVDKFGLAIALPRTTGEALRNVAPATLPILSNISFDMAPGQVVAILGSSGSGKTTLLNALAQRAAKSLQSGSIKFNGLDPKVFESHMAYVQQIDYLMPYLTVRETLRYSAELRLDSGLSRKEKHALVEEVILELGLKDCADTIIGDDWRKGISGGEKRRVSVGCQLLLNPSLIFMDEPTTGGIYCSQTYVVCLLIICNRAGCIHRKQLD